MPKRGRSSELNQARNRALITRYWYWTVIWQRRHDSILEAFEKEEFFLKPAVVNIILRNDNDIYRSLQAENPSVKELAKRFPAYHWSDNPHVWNKKPAHSEVQTKLF